MEVVWKQKLHTQKKLMRERWGINVTYQSAGSSQYEMKLVILTTTEGRERELVKSQALMSLESP